jgi:hypothetical protein
MSMPELDNLVRINKLKREPGRRSEFEGMVRSARTHLADAQNESIATDSRFDLASMGPPTDWQAPRCASTDTVRKTALRFSKLSFIRPAQIKPTYKSFSGRIMSGIWPSTKVEQTLTSTY